MKKSKKIIIIILAVLLAIILALISAFLILTYIGKSQFHKQDTNISTNAVEVEDESTISYNNKEYVLNKNIVSVLVMGIDRNNINETLGNGNNGQADVVFVATIDTKTKRTCIIPISRETMVDVNLFTAEGKFAGTAHEQLCLAYAYGNTTAECSENVMKSVRRLLCGINISSYVTIEMDGIGKLTDMIGGIQLTCLEDSTDSKYFFKKGEKLNLNKETAIAYIQYRGNDTEANVRRMARQKQFLSALINKTGNSVLNDFSKLPQIYTSLSPYYNTNVSFAQITYLAQNCLTANFGDSFEYKIIDGKIEQGEKWIEFHPSQESILQNVIDVFYTPVE